jgi:hypothetical protein
MDIIKKRIRIKKAKNAIRYFSKLNLEDENNFNKFTKCLHNKSVLNITKVMLTRINMIFDGTDVVNPRIFLMSYLINKFPDMILSVEKNKIESEIYELSCKLIYKINLLKQDLSNDIIFYLYINNFKKVYNEFNGVFQLWQFMDKHELIQTCALRYDSLLKSFNFIKYESNFDEITKVETIKIIEKQLIDTEKKIKSLDKTFDLKQYINLKNKVELNMNNIYWDNFKKDIEKDNYDCLLNSIKEIIKEICLLIPNRKDIHREIEEDIDIEFYENLIENRIISKKYFKKIFNWLLKLSSPIREQELKDKWETLNDYDEIFKFLYNIIYLIKMDIMLISKK